MEVKFKPVRLISVVICSAISKGWRALGWRGRLGSDLTILMQQVTFTEHITQK